MRAVMIGLLLVAMCGPAQARVLAEDLYWVALERAVPSTPARYMHRFRGRLVERQASIWTVDELCSRLLRRQVSRVDGCSIRGRQGRRQVCYIIYRSGHARQHEVAHCNGWRH